MLPAQALNRHRVTMLQTFYARSSEVFAQIIHLQSIYCIESASICNWGEINQDPFRSVLLHYSEIAVYKNEVIRQREAPPTTVRRCQNQSIHREALCVCRREVKLMMKNPFQK